ncbi:condensation domain-containing protein [Solwaraspora sp. WMMB335]|uniref:condensation domain-containing protein n=1 Tax=Solwaraspora sp. WMMB335 TaxID=3404118 RepID=UPI003B94AAAA
MDSYPLTPSQARSLEGRSLADAERSVLPVVLGSSKRLDERRLRTALRSLTRSHAALRLRLIRTPDGEYRQVLAPPRDDEDLLTVIDIGPVPQAAQNHAIAVAFERMALSFDLRAGPVFRAALVRTGGDDVLVLAVHHFSCDVVSLGVLALELQRAYDGDHAQPPVPPGSGYASYLSTLRTGPPVGAAPPAEAWWLDRPWREVSQPAGVDTTAMFEFGTDNFFSTSLTFPAAPTSREFEAYLLSALASAMFEVCGLRWARLDTLHHGRRTGTRHLVGWISRMVPHLLPADASPDVHLKEIDEVRGKAAAWEDAQARIRAHHAGLWETICRTGHVLVNFYGTVLADVRRKLSTFYPFPYQPQRMIPPRRPSVYPVRLLVQRQETSVDLSWTFDSLFRDRQIPREIATHATSSLAKIGRSLPGWGLST